MQWNFMVERAMPAHTQLRDDGGRQLSEGEAELAIERFAVTANNVSYAKAGEMLGYWRFFPVEADGWGIVPVWGFATVTQSRCDGVLPGQRFYGFLPMASRLIAQPAPHRGGFLDVSPHRKDMAAVYNNYARADVAGPFDDRRALLQPLLVTSFLIDHFLADADSFDAKRIVLSSASSKTAMGLAWFQRQRGKLEVIGLTSATHVEAIDSTGCYDRLIAYGDLDTLPQDKTAIYVDFAGDRSLTARIHALLGERLVQSVGVGGTHWDAPATKDEIVGIPPKFFFAPDHAQQRIALWGSDGFETRYTAALQAFIAANPWLTIEHHEGPEGLETAWRNAIEGRVSPLNGMIVSLERREPQRTGG